MGKRQLFKGIFPGSAIVLCQAKEGKNNSSNKKNIYGIYKYLSEVKISYTAFQAGICSWQWWTERKQKLVEAKMQDSKLK